MWGGSEPEPLSPVLNLILTVTLMVTINLAITTVLFNGNFFAKIFLYLDIYETGDLNS